MKAIVLIAVLATAGPAFAEAGADKAYIFEGPVMRLPPMPRPNPPLALAPLPESAPPFVPPPPAKPKKKQLQLAQAMPEPQARPLPPGSFQYDGARREFTPPSPVTIGDGPRQLPPGSIQQDRVPLKPFGAPAPKAEEKPKQGIG